MSRKRKSDFLQPREMTFTFDVPVCVVVKHDGAHWFVTRVVVCDEDLDTDLKHAKVTRAGVELPHDNEAAISTHNALHESDWPAWEFGW